jgi:hypothetical protein
MDDSIKDNASTAAHSMSVSTNSSNEWSAQDCGLLAAGHKILMQKVTHG